LFETSVDRVLMPLRFGRSHIELAFDRGRISTPDHHLNISEIEIELKDGDRRDMAMLARRLAKTFPVAYEARSKSERGYALAEGTLTEAVSARPVQIDPAMTTGDAFATIGFECLRHVASNEIAVRHFDPDGIHQMRVGLRRLRAALSLFKEMLDGRETHRIKGGLVWLTEQLGPARDYEVMVSQSIDPLLEQHLDRPELRLLESDFKHERDKGYAVANAAVANPRYRHMVLDTALWLLDDEWWRRARKIAKRVRKLEALDPRGRHKLRIAVKKMRYACEFFEVPIVREVGKKPARKFDRSLKDMQSGLGKLNDMVVHARLASELTRSSRATQRAFAMGYLVGQESAASRRLLSDASQAGKRLQKAAIF
jgi:inorganic triphosphatase YgiF